MIIYEKMQVIQGKTVETLFFFFQLRIHKVQYVLYPTRGGLETHSISVTLGVQLDIRVVRIVKLLMMSVSRVKEPISLHSRDRMIPRGSTPSVTRCRLARPLARELSITLNQDLSRLRLPPCRIQPRRVKPWMAEDG